MKYWYVVDLKNLCEISKFLHIPFSDMISVVGQKPPGPGMEPALHDPTTYTIYKSNFGASLLV